MVSHESSFINPGPPDFPTSTPPECERRKTSTRDRSHVGDARRRRRLDAFLALEVRFSAPRAPSGARFVGKEAGVGQSRHIFGDAERDADVDRGSRDERGGRESMVTSSNRGEEADRGR